MSFGVFGCHSQKYRKLLSSVIRYEKVNFLIGNKSIVVSERAAKNKTKLLLKIILASGQFHVSLIFQTEL